MYTEKEKDQNPISEFKNSGLASLVFPALFPSCKENPINLSAVRRIIENMTDTFV